MFEFTSRYYQLPTATQTLPSGRTVAYVRRRLLPHGADLQTLAEVTVAQGDRLDLVAERTLGDSQAFWRICDANDALDPLDLLEPGRVLRIGMPGT